jgi:ATP adenylyltransferase
MNRFPYNPGHLLVLPREHIGDFDKLPNKAWQKISLATKLCIEKLKSNSNPHGFNVGLNLGSASGAGIPSHLHWHILPRWSGDTNFMPLIAETKALPTHNETIYNQLKPLFSHFSKELSDNK